MFRPQKRHFQIVAVFDDVSRVLCNTCKCSIKHVILLHNQVTVCCVITVKGKAVPLQAYSGPEGSKKLKFPAFITMAPTAFIPGNIPGTHFCYRLNQHHGHSANGRIMSLKNSNDIIGNRIVGLSVSSVVP